MLTVRKKYKQILLFLGLVSICFTNSCHKYPEGAWTNSAIKHLFGANKDGASKTWKLKLYEVNDIDSTGFIAPNNGFTNFQNDAVMFSITNAHANDFFASSKVFSYGVGFSKDKRTISFIGGLETGIINQCNNGICERGIFNPTITSSSFDWKIIKLKSDEFVITSNQINSYKIILTN